MTIDYVILTYNQEKILDWQLEALKKQTRKPNNIIVIDNNSKRKYRKRKGVIQKRLEYKGPDKRSIARNLGAELSNADVILFLDGDIIPGYDFTEYAYFFYVEPENKKNIYMPNRKEIYNKSELKKRMESLYSPLKGIMKRRKLVLLQEYGVTFPSAAFGVKRDFFISTGGFDSRFTGWGFEDTELAYRMRKQGSRFMMNPFVFVHHKAHPRPEFDPVFKDKLYSNAKLLQELHPNDVTNGYLTLHLTEWGFDKEEIKQVIGRT